MKNFFLIFFWKCAAMLIVSHAQAQQRIALSDVQKILLTTAEGSMGPSTEIDMEVINENGKWNSYQVIRDFFNTDQGGERSSISLERKLIATLSALQITAFLNSIATIKPVLDDHTFNLSTAKLKADLQKEVREPGKTSKLNDLIDDAAISRAILGVIKDIGVADWGKTCSISIVKTNGDVLKMETRHLYITMLPWTMNKQDSYDVNINAFFIAAMGNQQYPNRATLDINNLEDCIYDYLGGNKIAGTLKMTKPGN